MTSLLARTVALPTKWRFLFKNLNQLDSYFCALQICTVELQWKCIEKTVILKNYSFLLLTYIPCIFYKLKIVILTLFSCMYLELDFYCLCSLQKSSSKVSVVIWFAPWSPVRESWVRIRLLHRNLTKFILQLADCCPSKSLKQCFGL